MGLCLSTGNTYLQSIQNHYISNFSKNGLVPEDYGLKSFSEEAAEEFRGWNKDRLINEILDLRKSILAY